MTGNALTFSGRTPEAGRRAGFSLADVACGLAAVALLFGAVVPVAGQFRRQDATTKCAANLRQVAMAMMLYANDNRGHFPRARLDPATVDKPTAYTNWKGPNSLPPADPAKPHADPAPAPEPNDVTAALYLVFKTQELGPEAFVCPATKATPLPLGDAKPAPKDPLAKDRKQLSNFPGPQHLSYSMNNPYPSRKAIEAGWRFNTTLGAEHPIAADMNPGGPAVARITAKTPKAEQAKGNSPNHAGTGQNVVYADGHVEWQTTPLCGAPAAGAGGPNADRDNIYAPAGAEAVMGPSTAPGDAVLLPPADFKVDAAGGAGAASGK